MQLFKVLGAMCITIILWASAFVGIRIGLLAYSPGSLALLRFLVASLLMIFIYWTCNHEGVLSWKARIQLLVGGMAGIGVYNLCLNYGEQHVSAGVASFIVGLMPVITVVLSWIFLREKANVGVCSGILISIMGLVLLAFGEHTGVQTQLGIVAILVSAFMGALLTVIQKQFVGIYHPIVTISWAIWGGTLLLLFFVPDLIHDIQYADAKITISVVYMGIFPAALAYLAWAYALKHWPASNVATSLYAMPVVSALLGYLILDEHFTVISLIGSLIMLLGAIIAGRSRFRMMKLVALKVIKIV